MTKHTLLGRSSELKELKEFIRLKTGGMIYIRGRRRVGKSALLIELSKTTPSTLYFFGSPDSTSQKLLLDFAESWDKFTGQPKLTELRSLSWSKIFNEITEYAKKRKNIVLIFDEIQWIAKSKSGCIGALKNAWQYWENLGVKVIICGSSNRFFLKNSGGEESILRGMKTRSDLWIHPFSLAEVKRFYFPKWKDEEIALTYMMLGGIPYYLKRFESSERGFIQCVNDAVFLKNSIFLEEINEILRLEFNEHGLKTAKIILSMLGQDGRTQNEIQKATGLALTTVARTLESLFDYGIIFQKTQTTRPKKNESGIRYFMKDFFLNFYFQVLIPFQHKIENNSNHGLLFPQVFENSRSHFYIQNFSGKAFELLVRYCLERKTKLTTNLFKKLLLRDFEYEVLDFSSKNTQIDLIVESKKDRISRLIECKWVSPTSNDDSKHLDSLLQKLYVPPLKTYSVKRFLCISKHPSTQLLTRAKENEITVIQLEDLFS